jgi:hypothetical protein
VSLEVIATDALVILLYPEPAAQPAIQQTRCQKKTEAWKASAIPHRASAAKGLAVAALWVMCLGGFEHLPPSRRNLSKLPGADRRRK